MSLRDTSSIVREGRLPLTPHNAGNSPDRPVLLKFNICAHTAHFSVPSSLLSA